jgi:hypothetical protein
MNKKLDPIELSTLQNLNKEFSSIRAQIADAAMAQHMFMGKLEETKKSYRTIENSFVEKYGNGAHIDLETGAVTFPDQGALEPQMKVSKKSDK